MTMPNRQTTPPRRRGVTPIDDDWRHAPTGYRATRDVTRRELGARGTNAKQAQNTHEETPESPENYAMRV